VIAPLARAVNAAVSALLAAPGLGPRIGRRMTTISYVGRRSGRSFSTPVGYRRNGDTVTIEVGLPDAKNWWRNFTGKGAPITLRLDGVERTGHAIAQRTGSRVTVSVILDPVPARH